MRIVLDTNILTRAFGSAEGPAGKALERIRSPHLLVVSLQILEELADVLDRPRVRRLHGRDDVAIDGFLRHVERLLLLSPFPKNRLPMSC